MTTTRQDINDYRDQVFARKLRICEWLGMSAANVFELDDTDPNVDGEVEVTWKSVEMERLTRGTLIEVGAHGSYEGTVHTGKVWLSPDDATAMRAAAGPRPVFPMSSEDRVRLEQLRAHEEWRP